MQEIVKVFLTFCIDTIADMIERGVTVTAITLSPSQKAFAERRIADAGLGQRFRRE